MKKGRLNTSDESVIKQWINIHNKPWINDTDDLEYQLDRYMVCQNKIKATSSVITIIVSGLFSWALFEEGAKFFLLLFGTLGFAMITFIMTKFILQKNTEVINSCCKFLKDFKKLNKLSETKQYDYYLSSLGERIVSAERLRDKELVKKLKAEFKHIHSILLPFGQCHQDWGIYIPKQTIIDLGNGDRLGL